MRGLNNVLVLKMYMTRGEHRASSCHSDTCVKSIGSSIKKQRHTDVDNALLDCYNALLASPSPGDVARSAKSGDMNRLSGRHTRPRHDGHRVHRTGFIANWMPFDTYILQGNVTALSGEIQTVNERQSVGSSFDTCALCFYVLLTLEIWR
jgi:hypothetical protein